jgi:hypothetical protein
VIDEGEMGEVGEKDLGAWHERSFDGDVPV